ncbi:YeeE/YedE thiosulfate transporter family protein [bacterium]|nr:YeeE/YedE thiosulfate transporter family protein [bacterium]
MKNFIIALIGIFFGIVLSKSEAISWFRIVEMFRFESFHMYGIIGTAVVLGIIFVFLVKKFDIKAFGGVSIKIKPKELRYAPLIIGGIIFGLGWALTGACPGPIYILIGNGFSVYLVVLLSALLGAFTLGVVRHKLPS